jgi:hypothetical protein
MWIEKVRANKRYFAFYGFSYKLFLSCCLPIARDYTHVQIELTGLNLGQVFNQGTLTEGDGSVQLTSSLRNLVLLKIKINVFIIIIIRS